MIWRFLDNKKERGNFSTRTCIIIFPGYQKSSPFWWVNRSPFAYLTCHELAARGQWELDVMLVLKPLHHFCSHASQCWLSRVQLAIQPARHGRPWTILTISLQTTSRSQHCKNNCWQGEIMLLPEFYSVLTIHLSQRSSSIWQDQTQTHSHGCLPLQPPRQRHLQQLPNSVVTPRVVETNLE